MNGNSGVQSDPVSFNGTAQRGLFDQKSGPLSQNFLHVSPALEQPMCRLKPQIFATSVWHSCHITPDE